MINKYRFSILDRIRMLSRYKTDFRRDKRIDGKGIPYLSWPRNIVGFSLILFVMFSGCQRSAYVGPEYSGMSPTIDSEDLFWVDEGYYSRYPITRFDVVLMEDEIVKYGRRVLRVIGLPGENVAMSNGQLTIDGQGLDVPTELTFLKCLWTTDPHLSFQEKTVPSGHLFLLGDNFMHSYDSRMTGPFPKGRVIGKVIRIQKQL